MAYSIWVDSERSTAMLVMDEPLFALGPAVEAGTPDEARLLMQTFVENLEADPSTMPTIQLMNEWQGFLMAFHGVIQVPAELAPEDSPQGAESPAAEPEGETPAPQDGAPQTGADALSSAIDASPTSSEAGAGDVSSAAPPAPVAVLDADRDTIDCWACGGDGELNIAGQLYECKTCGGTGKLPPAQG